MKTPQERQRHVRPHEQQPILLPNGQHNKRLPNNPLLLFPVYLVPDRPRGTLPLRLFRARRLPRRVGPRAASQ